MAEFTIKQGDTSPAIEATLKDNEDNVVNLTGAAVRFHMSTMRFKTLVDEEGTLVEAVNGKVMYEWSPGDTDTFGEFFAEWEVTYSDGTVETFPNGGYTHINVLKEIA